MDLKLNPIKPKILKVEKLDGSILEIKLKSIKVSELEIQERKIRELDKKLIKKQIYTIDYLFEVFDLIIENLNRDDFLDFPNDHMLQISESLRELQTNQGKKEPEEKKNQSEIKSSS